MKKGKLIKHSTATYKMDDGTFECDLDELCKEYRSVGNIPLHLGWDKACEISVLAQGFIQLKKAYRCLAKKGKRG